MNVERDSNLTGTLRANLETVAAESAASGCERETLECSFDRFQFKVGKRTWNRADLYVRS
jgi:hypothetical protein